MGTFTKAFGSVGGYLAANKVSFVCRCCVCRSVYHLDSRCLLTRSSVWQDVVTYLRNTAFSSQYSAPMSPPAAQQAISALKIILGEDGTTIGALRCAQCPDPI